MSTTSTMSLRGDDLEDARVVAQRALLCLAQQHASYFESAGPEDKPPSFDDDLLAFTILCDDLGYPGEPAGKRHGTLYREDDLLRLGRACGTCIELARIDLYFFTDGKPARDQQEAERIRYHEAFIERAERLLSVLLERLGAA